MQGPQQQALGVDTSPQESPHTDLEPLDLPLGCLALVRPCAPCETHCCARLVPHHCVFVCCCGAKVVGQLGSKDLLALFRVGHHGRLLVLSHAHKVKLSPAPEARLHVLARLLEVPAADPCFTALQLFIRDAQEAQLALLPTSKCCRQTECMSWSCGCAGVLHLTNTWCQALFRCILSGPAVLALVTKLDCHG